MKQDPIPAQQARRPNHLESGWAVMVLRMVNLETLEWFVFRLIQRYEQEPGGTLRPLPVLACACSSIVDGDLRLDCCAGELSALLFWCLRYRFLILTGDRELIAGYNTAGG